jgi:hypothetical protein
VRAALVLALGLAACGGSKQPVPAPAVVPDAGVAAAEPGEIPEKLKAEVEEAIAFIEALTAAAATVGTADPEDADCEAMAAAMRPVVDGEHGQAIFTIDHDPDSKPYAMALNQAYGARLDAAGDGLAHAINACTYDPAIMQILIDTGMVQPPESQPALPDD